MRKIRILSAGCWYSQHHLVRFSSFFYIFHCCTWNLVVSKLFSPALLLSCSKMNVKSDINFGGKRLRSISWIIASISCLQQWVSTTYACSSFFSRIIFSNLNANSIGGGFFSFSSLSCHTLQLKPVVVDTTNKFKLEK